MTMPMNDETGTQPFDFTLQPLPDRQSRPIVTVPVARLSDPDTSAEAARTVKQSTVLRIRADIELALRNFGPLTDEGVYDVLSGWSLQRLSPSGVRTRRCEMERDGLVEWSGEYGKTRAGRRARRWQLADRPVAVSPDVERQPQPRHTE